MPKKRVNELIRCKYFNWILYEREGVLYADGRPNKVKAGRHSLDTRDREEALRNLHDLDARIAADLGLAPRPAAVLESRLLLLDDGRRLYEEHIKRPIVAGGVKPSTQKRYRAVFDKFLPFAKNRNVPTWNGVDIGLLHAYASHLDADGYAAKTLRNELVTLVQTQKFLVIEKHLVGVEPLKLHLRKVESQRAYCYTPEQVAAMVGHCGLHPGLQWLGGVVVGLACTGLRISELASLRWSDVDLAHNRLSLTDESGRAGAQQASRRQLKSGRSRWLPINADFAPVLKAISRRDAFIFHGPRSGRLKPDTVRQVLIREVIKPLTAQFPSPPGERGFADGRLHSFRHYFASACATNPEVTEQTAMLWLGHADSAMVRHYFHLHDKEAQRQMSKLHLLGEAGEQPPGNSNGAATNKSEVVPSPERTDENRS